VSQNEAFTLIRGLFDQDDAFWWTAHGLVAFSALARRVASGAAEETRYWLTVYQQLKDGP